MIKNMLLVALGGALGSVARYVLSAAVQASAQSNYPWGTMAVNVLGCLVIGFVSALAAAHGMISPGLKLLLATGFCGGFTTFSTFMQETLTLTSTGNATTALLYIVASVAMGFMAAAAGMAIGRLC